MTIHGLILALVNFGLGATVFVMSLIGLGFLILIARFFLDEASAFNRSLPTAPPLLESDWPEVLLQIPCFNESHVVGGALLAAAALDYPKDRLLIQLLDDSTDDTSRIAAETVAQLQREGARIEHIRREDRSGFKAGACAEGLKRSQARFIAMLDIDFRPPRDWLTCAIPVLVEDPKAGFVQSRCEFSNYQANWLTRVQGLVLDGHFLIEQRSRANIGWLFQFNGTGGVWRREAIDSVGGWLDYSLTEDLDLTIRTALAGWHGRFIQNPVVPGQMPEGMRDWRRQQRRWSNGFIQVAQRTIAPLWRAPWPISQRIAAIGLVLHQVFFPICAAAVLLFVLGGALNMSFASYKLLLIYVASITTPVVIGMTLPPYVALKRGPLWRYFMTMAMIPPLFVYLALANAPKIISTARGRVEHFKRTPKVET